MKFTQYAAAILTLILVAGVSLAGGGPVETPAPPMIDGPMTGAESAGEDKPTVEPGEGLEPEPAVKPGPTVEDESTAARAEAMMPVREFTDPSTPIKAILGEEFVIALDANPTTGYSWRFSGKFDESILQLVESKFQAPGTQLKGAGGTRIYILKAIGRGKATVSLEYLRPWEKKRRPVKKVVFHVTVQ